jgi:hypothetical protein
MKNYIIIICLPFILCNCSEVKLSKEEKKILYSFGDSYIYKTQDTIGLELCFGKESAKSLLEEPNERQYLMTIKNIGYDTLIVPIRRSSSGAAIFETSHIDYFKSISDSVKISDYLPFTGSTELLKIVKGSERYFVTDLPVGHDVARIKYQFYLDYYKKREIIEFVYLTKREGRFVQLSK